MRTISANFLEQLFAADGDEVVVMLVTVVHPDIEGGDLFLSSDNKDLLDFEQQLRGTVSRGRNYQFLPMSIALPEEGDDASSVIQIVIDNVTREITPLLKATIHPAYVTIELVLASASAPDAVEVEFPDFEMVSADVDAGKVVLSLTVDTMASEPYPADNFTPSTFGGLWATT